MPNELQDLIAKVAALEARVAALEQAAKPGQTESEARAAPYVKD